MKVLLFLIPALTIVAGDAPQIGAYTFGRYADEGGAIMLRADGAIIVGAERVVAPSPEAARRAQRYGAASRGAHLYYFDESGKPTPRGPVQHWAPIGCRGATVTGFPSGSMVFAVEARVILVLDRRWRRGYTAQDVARLFEQWLDLAVAECANA